MCQDWAIAARAAGKEKGEGGKDDTRGSTARPRAPPSRLHLPEEVPATAQPLVDDDGDGYDRPMTNARRIDLDRGASLEQPCRRRLLFLSRLFFGGHLGAPNTESARARARSAPGILAGFATDLILHAAGA